MKSECLELINKLLSHPIVQYFNDRIIPEVKNDENITITFVMVKDKLVDNKYSTFSQWEKEVLTIFSACKSYFESEPTKQTIINSVSELFSKYMISLSKFRMNKWANAVSGYQRTLEMLFSNPPPIVSAHSEIPADLANFDEKSLSEDEINVFVRVSQYLQSPEDSRAIASIIQKCQPELEFIDKDTKIDVSDLSTQTLTSLRGFFAQRLAQMNLKYPR